MDNKKIPTIIGTIIILIIAITVGVFIWQYEKSQPDIENIQVTNKQKNLSEKNPSTKITTNDTGQQGKNNTKNQENIQAQEIPERISGTNCYRDDLKDDALKFTQAFNATSPTAIIEYSNPEKGISFDIPYNPNWGTKNCKVEPYTEFEQPGGDILVEFGKPRENMASEFLLTISKQRSAEEIIAEQDDDNEPNPNPREKTIDDKKMVIYESYGMTTERIYEVVGKNYNYSFSYFEVDTLKNNSIKALENIIASVKFISSN